MNELARFISLRSPKPFFAEESENLYHTTRESTISNLISMQYVMQ